MDATTIFSPSKAAAARAAAADWHHIDTWLSRIYRGRSVPVFERNPETLSALLALLAANERADEERDLLWQVEKEALPALQDDDGLPPSSHTAPEALASLLADALPPAGRDALSALASTTAILNAPSASLPDLAAAVITQSSLSHSTSQHLTHLTTLQHQLERDLAALRQRLTDLRAPALQAPLALPRQTLEWGRNTKQLRTKLGEYAERLGRMEGGDLEGGVSEVVAVVKAEGRVGELLARVKGVEERVRCWEGLPSDREEARGEVRRVEREVDGLKRRRDELFEKLVEKG
ncbi:hypothetical protein EJ06DRAFT_36357 [Trichodelitschia bisporula]|uniref:HAUS augmin-like complex subunit 1 n=1 Tax=Trichodelitschia bisporula TaxID=703511 RepID=A0A6G1HUU1_9PEZI|nr:hypothetical protein EJ06DRAFT_36357 [Trichodelitschia bisporula]